MRIEIKSGRSRDRHSTDYALVGSLVFRNHHMEVSLGYQDSDAHIVRIWEHTIYELENLSSGIRLAAEGRLPKSFTTASADTLLGPTVHLWPAIAVEVGHPGLDDSGRGAMFYCSTKESRLAKRRLVYLNALLKGRSSEAIFEVEDALIIADLIYEEAKRLAIP